VRSLVALLLLAGASLALPVATSAASCQLTTAVSPGHVITITGSGFAASQDVAITQTWSGSNATAGGNTRPQTTTTSVTADASGGFEFTIDAGPGHGGTYDIEATGGGCTATTTVAALETAGGVNPGGAPLPATDTVSPGLRGPAPLSPTAPLAAIVTGVALLGLAAVLRRARTSGTAR
jgi:hypothetical protein